MASDPYTQTAKLLDAGPSPTKRSATPAAPKAPPSSIPDVVVVGKRYEDPESRADEEYMKGAQKRIEGRLKDYPDRITEAAWTSGEYRKRRMIDRRFGRRSGR